jgi:hypothetical protein
MCMNIFLHFLILFGLNKIRNVESFLFNSENSLTRYKYERIDNFTIPQSPIIAKGWMKYTTFTKVDKDKPKEFFKNQAFYEQMNDGKTIDLTKKDAV